MEARAVTTSTLVGQTTLDLVSSKPLLIRPQTPRFLVAGDQVRFGATIQNNTNQPLKVAVSLQAEGVDLGNTTDQKWILKPIARYTLPGTPKCYPQQTV
jgi:uncharacterized protein YfaS (alpha-2-macroglobulin family)